MVPPTPAGRHGYAPPPLLAVWHPRVLPASCVPRACRRWSRKNSWFEREWRAAKAGAVGLAVRSRVVLILPRFLPELFSAAIASGVGHLDCELFFAPLPKRGDLNACARRLRLWDSSHDLEPGDMHTSIVFDYTTASDFSNPTHGPTVFTGVVAS